MTENPDAKRKRQVRELDYENLMTEFDDIYSRLEDAADKVKKYIKEHGDPEGYMEYVKVDIKDAIDKVAEAQADIQEDKNR